MTTRYVLVLALLAVAGCATVPQNDPELEGARAAVYAARSNPQVITYAPAELDRAGVALRDAEDLAARNGSIGEVHRLAEVAQRHAAAAQETARIRTAEAAQRNAQEARLQADLTRQQADAAQVQAAAAQRRAEEAQRQAAAAQIATAPPNVVVVQPPPTDLLARVTDRGVVFTLADPMFAPGGDRLTPDAMNQLQKVAAYLAARPERNVTIEGFSDDSGNRVLDRRLSEDRALAAQSALISLGVEARRIAVRSYGDARPLASNDTPAGRQINRRVEIVIL